MAEIVTSKGVSIIVDDEDFEYLSQWKWKIGRNGYAQRSTYVDGKFSMLIMHRVINNTPKGLETDHINGERLDNRKINLRTATRLQNRHNVKSFKNTTSRYKGISWSKNNKSWIAQICCKGNRYHLGSFDDELDAAKCYDVHAVKYFGEFARTNFGGNNVVSR